MNRTTIRSEKDILCSCKVYLIKLIN